MRTEGAGCEYRENIKTSPRDAIVSTQTIMHLFNRKLHHRGLASLSHILLFLYLVPGPENRTTLFIFHVGHSISWVYCHLRRQWQSTIPHASVRHARQRQCALSAALFRCQLLYYALLVFVNCALCCVIGEEARRRGSDHIASLGKRCPVTSEPLYLSNGARWEVAKTFRGDMRSKR